MKDTLAFNLVYLYKDFLNYVNKELKKQQLSHGQLPFILYIGKHDGTTPSQLKEALHMDWGHAQRSITKLVDQGFVTKYYEADNKRNAHLSLTSKGYDVFTFAHQLFQDWDHECLQSMNPEEHQQLLQLLKKLTLTHPIK